MLALIFAVLFGVSLLPWRKPLCLKFAERVSDGILPDGAEAYCRRLTWLWFAFLSLLTATNAVCLWIASGEARWGWAIRIAPSIYAAILIPLGIFGERFFVRPRRFRAVFHTSGSSGRSKTIVKSFESLAKEVAYHRSRLSETIPGFADGTSGVTFLATIEPHHMYGTLWRVMLPKATKCAVDPEVIMTPESLVAKMKDAEKVFLVTTPSFLDRFTAYAGQYDVPRNCVEITTSGALLTADVAHRTEKVFGIAPREIFGSTETGGVAWRRQSAGKEREDFDWQVFDPVKVSSEGGRLAVKSPFSFVRRYVMGDGVELSPDARRFRLLGRLDRLVKISEQRVDLEEMERAMRGVDGVSEAALVKLSGEHGDFLGAIVVPRQMPADAEEKRKAALELRSRLIPVFPKGTVPKKYRFAESLPRNPQGKVRAADLAALFEGK